MFYNYFPTPIYTNLTNSLSPLEMNHMVVVWNVKIWLLYVKTFESENNALNIIIKPY